MRLLLAALARATLVASAQAQLVPAPGDQAPELCPDRPPDPPIITEMGVRDAHLTLLLREMYKAAAYQDIVETGTCACDQRFPDWEPVVRYYLGTYAGEDDHGVVRERRSFYRDSASANRPRVREICLAAGNWRGAER